MKKIFLFLVSTMIFIACSDDDKGPEKSDANSIESFSFLVSDNEGIYNDVTAVVNEASKTIVVTVPARISLSSLKPTLELSAKATVRPQSKVTVDVSKDVIYTVTAEDGTQRTYTLKVTKADFTDKDVLIKLFEANPNNTIEWDLKENDLSKWQWVALDADGRVQDLLLEDKGIEVLPAEIGKLTKLKLLNLNDNSIEVLPTEIEALTSLRDLYLRKNNLSTFPSEIGRLQNLVRLWAEGNKIASLPPEIGELGKLSQLILPANQLKNLPSEIINLDALTILWLIENTLEELPDQIGQLSNLRRLSLNNNQLTSLPESMGSLTRLEYLDIRKNSDLAGIPGSICNLEIEEVLADPEVFCEF